ncbi:MAG TPA: hypothetical protein VMI54_10490 [Polyangiaceae bacterium]|nr:hypothetical protein [Polyangiaceae bacterium]
MNFFGHAAIAGHFEADPVFVLGAMLPDFCGMLGFRAPDAVPGRLGAGVRFHHVTDHAFHARSEFQRLNRDACADLDARGVRRGTARAVAHVGVELLLDAELAEDDAARARYLAALEAGHDLELFARAPFASDDAARLERLARALAERGVAKRPSSASVVERLERALRARPKLAIAVEDTARVGEWVELFRARVVASAPTLVRELVLDIEQRLAA